MPEFSHHNCGIRGMMKFVISARHYYLPLALSSSITAVRTTTSFAYNSIPQKQKGKKFIMSSLNMNTVSGSEQNMITKKELMFQCSDGVKLAAQEWLIADDRIESSSSSSSNDKSKAANDYNNDSHNNILCLHGWLDNSASFDQIGPALLLDVAKQQQQQQQEQKNSNYNEYSNVRIVALDFPGHGLSSHKSPDGPTQLISEYAFYVYEVLQNGLLTNGNGKNKVTLIGHSMGAAVSLIFASSFPEYVDKVILLDGAGPMSRPIVDFSKHIKKAILTRSNNNKVTQSKPRRIYPSLEEAVKVRMRTAQLSPGKQYISREAATALVERAIVPATAIVTNGNDSQLGQESSPLVFRHDPRLYWPSIQYCTPEQVNIIYESVECPVCLLRAKDGYPISQQHRQDILSLLNPQMEKILPGSHHFHADPNTALAVVDSISQFLKNY